jgi:hypothetical protein
VLLKQIRFGCVMYGSAGKEGRVAWRVREVSLSILLFLLAKSHTFWPGLKTIFA